MAKIRNFAAGTLLAAAAAAQAAELPKEGSYDTTACWSGASNPISFSKTHSAFSYEMTGTNRSDPPGGLFDRNTFRCVGTRAKFDKRAFAMLTCEAIDPDGDKRLTFYMLGADGKFIRENVIGTGKYEGMVAEGSVQPLGLFPTIKAGMFQGCNHQTGTYKLK